MSENMVDEETGEIHENYIQLTGTCIYCNQNMIIKWPAGVEWTQKTADMAATERCNCRDAQKYSNICAREKAAQRIIEKKFGENSDDESAQLDYETIQLLTKIAFEIAKEKIEKASFNLGNGIKCSMSLTASGKIKIKRTRTKEESDEV